MQNPLGSHTSVTHPSLHIRDANDAHIILEAVRLNILPLIKRRLATTEREQLKTGNVFVWEEAEDDGGLLRWTDGRRWSQSRMRGDYLYYEEKVETTQDEKDAKAARRARRASDPTAIIPPPTRRKDRPTKPNGLTKQTYSALVQLPGSPSPKKWHVVAYFSGNDYTRLPVIENYEYLRNVRVPPGIYVSSKAGARLDQMPAFPEEIDDYGTPERHLHPSGEMHTDPRVKAHLQPYPGHYAYGYPTSPPSSSSSPPSSLMSRYLSPPLAPTKVHDRQEKVILPPLSSLCDPESRPRLHHRQTTPAGHYVHPSERSPTSKYAPLSPEDRRVLDSFKIVL
ncbi:hypothetical protein PC9H_011826 [Pleurotus ostreatus]|uniref:cAMP-independent regulatory protein pac2 n=1 Tax=Pleurotus ostreatus TaxID=5322 RepID=A0A8H7DPL1_PLEOS|nr:uncharacterized protein PC9H_011826 [Pleurotus ostreatus]KAF7421304.1 hypothetical protein PC9H_011826 [Pleurotus ostreatus]